jgi:hypothetical protein
MTKLDYIRGAIQARAMLVNELQRCRNNAEEARAISNFLTVLAEAFTLISQESKS